MLVIPDIRNVSCTLLSACADGFEPTRQFKSAIRRIGEIKIAKGKGFYVAMIATKDGHFHIDVISREALDPDKRPPTNCTVSELRGIAHSLYGQKTDVTFAATFRLPLSKLPPIMASQRVKASTDTVTIEATGGSFKVSGEAPFRSIRWWIAADEDARIALRSRREIEINDQYLITGFAPLASGFQAFVADQQEEPRNEIHE